MQLFDVDTFIFSPRIFVEFNTNSITKLYTSLRIGYSIVNARVDINSLYNQKKILPIPVKTRVEIISI